MPKRKSKQVRYITNGTVLGNEQIQGYRLIAGKNMTTPHHGETALRVRIPRDLTLTKYSCDSYSTTEDTRTLDELGYDFVIWNDHKKKWIAQNQFKGIMPADVSPHMAKEALKQHDEKRMHTGNAIDRVVDALVVGEVRGQEAYDLIQDASPSGATS